MIGDKPASWSDEEIGQLRQLWDQGIFASRIGLMVGRSKNSVIGKAHRLGLEKRRDAAPRRRVPMIVTNGHPIVGRSSNYNFTTNPRRSKPRRPPQAVANMIDIVPVNGTGITILELRKGQCHAVVKDGSRRDNELARYCGHPVWQEGQSYCAEHYTIYHQPPRPR